MICRVDIYLRHAKMNLFGICVQQKSICESTQFDEQTFYVSIACNVNAQDELGIRCPFTPRKLLLRATHPFFIIFMRNLKLVLKYLRRLLMYLDYGNVSALLRLYELLVIGAIFIMLLKYVILLAFYLFKPHALGIFMPRNKVARYYVIPSEI